MLSVAVTRQSSIVLVPEAKPAIPAVWFLLEAMVPATFRSRMVAPLMQRKGAKPCLPSMASAAVMVWPLPRKVPLKGLLSLSLA